jgi:site-specific recombinase XerD
MTGPLTQGQVLVVRQAAADWQHGMTRTTGLAAASVVEYARDTANFIAWLEDGGFTGTPAEVTAHDVREYRDYLVDLGRAPATVNRALVSLSLFLQATGRTQDNPVRMVDRVAMVARPPQALTRAEWNAVRRAAAALVPRDHGLALALVCLLRFAGPRVAEVAALCIPDARLSARHGLLIIRRGKGLKYREVPLVREAREPLDDYLDHRQELAERWARKAAAWNEAPPTWAVWPDGRLFLGQRGPLTERGIRTILAKLGQAAKLEAPLSPHDLRHTFAKALLDPAAYELRRPAVPITTVQELLGHAAIATTALYTRPTAADLARLMGEPDERP